MGMGEEEEFQKFFDETDGLESYDLSEIHGRLPDEWDSEKCKRFMKWFLEKGIKEDWIYADLGL
jgi:hypothetical protein